MKSSTTTIDPAHDVPEVLYEFTPEQVKVLEESRRRLNFTPEELAALEQKQRRMQAAFERMAAAPTLEEQERIAARLWAEQVERPRAARRIRQARRVAPSPSRPTRPGRASRIGRAKAAVRTSTPSRGDPDDDDPEPDGELTGRAAELAAELQAASDALIESWRVQSLAQAKHEQLSLDDRRWHA